MQKLLFLFFGIMILTSGCGKYGKLKLPPQEQKENKKENCKSS